MQVSEAKVAKYIKYVNRVEAFEPVLPKKEKQLSQALVEVHFLKNEIILKKSEMGNSFYILYDGQVDVPHQYAIVGTLSPAIPMVVFFTAITCWRGKLTDAVTNTNLWLLGLLICALCTIMITVEEIYIMGMGAIPWSAESSSSSSTGRSSGR